MAKTNTLLDEVETQIPNSANHNLDKNANTSNTQTSQPAKENTESKQQTPANNKQDNPNSVSQNLDTTEQTSNESQSTPNTEQQPSQPQATNNPTSLNEFLETLNAKEKKQIQTFMNTSVYDKFMCYLENYFSEKDTLIHRINCFCFRVKEDFTLRIHNKVYELKQGNIIYIQRDAFGISLLKNTKLERIL